MVLRTVGTSLIARLMKTEDAVAESSWLLFGPDDPDLIEQDNDEAWLLAAE